MMKTLTTLTAAATIAAALTAAPTDANAQRRAGARQSASAFSAASPPARSSAAPSPIPMVRRYVVQPGYVPYGAYAGGPPVGCPGGYWARMPVYDPYGNVVGYRGRPRYFCP